MKILKTNNQRISGLTEEQIETLKDRLTFDNPNYKNAVKFSRRGYISIPKYLFYYDYDRTLNVFSVPIGVDVEKILGVPCTEYDNRTDIKVSYPPFRLSLRKEQENAVVAYLKEQCNPYPKNIVQLPTGKGKTILALCIADMLSAKTLVLVHKDDLVVGWKKDIKECFGDIDVGLIKAKSRKIGEQITIATVQTLSRMSKEELAQYTSQFSLVVQDECHHIARNMFNIIGEFNSKYKLGLSATPKRSDGLDFTFELFLGGLAYKYEVTKDGDEDISQVKVSFIDSEFKYKPFVYKGEIFNYYDFKPEELPKNYKFVEEIEYKDRPTIPYLVIDNEAVTDFNTGFPVCKKILEEYHKGRSILVMFTQKEHVDLYYDYLSTKMPEKHLMKFYGNSKESTAKMMERAENKEVRVTLATYAKATEGTNVKSWEVLFLVSSLNNAKNVEQATGRIRRKKEGKLDPVLVYDVRYPKVYSLRSHSETRASTYRRLKYDIEGQSRKKSFLTRGYN